MISEWFGKNEMGRERVSNCVGDWLRYSGMQDFGRDEVDYLCKNESRESLECWRKRRNPMDCCPAGR